MKANGVSQAPDSPQDHHSDVKCVRTNEGSTPQEPSVQRPFKDAPQTPKDKRTFGLAQLIGLGFALGMALLVALASYTMLEVRGINDSVAQAHVDSARHELLQAVRTMVADSRAVLREVALWDETRKQLENPIYYQFWWRNRLMNPARVPHYVQAMEVYTAAGRSLSTVKETPLPERIRGPALYAVWDSYGTSLFNFVPILRQSGKWPPIGYLGVRISIPLAIPELTQFNSVYADSLSFALPFDRQISVQDLAAYVEFDVDDSSKFEPLIERVNVGITRLVFLNLFLFLGSLWLIHRFIVHPLSRLEAYVQQGEVGFTTPRMSMGGVKIRELERLRGAIDSYRRKLGQLNTSLDRKNAELWELAHLDGLTRVRNRLAFDEDWEKLLGMIDDESANVSFIMFDLDQLKAINDTHGHEMGDAVIRKVAELLGTNLREGEHLYRIGGDEFAVVLLEAEEGAGESIAARTLDSLAGFPHQTIGLQKPLRVSIGLAEGMVTGREGLEALRRRADRAMYQAKTSGRSRLAVHQ